MPSHAIHCVDLNTHLRSRYALSTQGPVVVSADASNWETYGGGIFDGCGRNAAVNHAVLAVGYGRSPQGPLGYGHSTRVPATAGSAGFGTVVTLEGLAGTRGFLSALFRAHHSARSAFGSPSRSAPHV